jgi:hypothetical protein
MRRRRARRQPRPAPEAARTAPSAPGPSAASEPFPALVTARSTDGGASWSPAGLITRDLGDGPSGFRCCLPSAVVDPNDGMMYASWNSLDATKVKLSSSRNGTDWTPPVVVNDPTPALLGVSSDVTAHGGMVTGRIRAHEREHLERPLRPAVRGALPRSRSAVRHPAHAWAEDRLPVRRTGWRHLPRRLCRVRNDGRPYVRRMGRLRHTTPSRREVPSGDLRREHRHSAFPSEISPVAPLSEVRP